MNNNWLKITPLVEPELVQFENEYQKVISVNPSERDLAWQTLHDFFVKQGQNADVEYQRSYFRWYTDLTWQRLKTLSEEDVISMGISRQIPTALWLGWDVWNELMFYLDSLNDPQKIENTFNKIREVFFASQAVVGSWQGKVFTVSEIVKDVTLTNQSNTDSLRSAEIFSKVKQVIEQANDQKYAIALPDEVFDRLVGLVNFFLGVKPEDVWYVVDSYLNPEKYEKPEEAGVVEITEPLVTETVVSEDDQVGLANYAEIKNMIEARFTRDASGEFVNLDGVLAFLETMAIEQGDEAIRDLYYYDEGVGKFQWNEALLT